MKKVVAICFFCLDAVITSAQFKFYEQGIDAYQANDYDKAIKKLNEYLDYTIRDKSYDVDVHYYLALSYFKLQSHTSAVREFDQALELGHKNVGNIHWFMGKNYAALKVPQQSIEEYTKALPLILEKLNQAKILYERSQQYLKLNEVSLAKEDLTHAAELDNTNEEIKNALRTSSINSVETPQRILNIQQDKTVVNTEPEKKTAPEEKKKASEEKKKEPEAISDVKNAEPSLAELYKDEKRYALIIGNSAYTYVAQLKNAANDAADMAAELEKSSFEVIKVINGNYNQMREAYRKFHEKLSSGPKDQTIGLFYYAGHGLQNEGENYLVPVEANIQYEDDIPRT